MKNLWVLIGSILATELTFELKENDEQCFFEEVNKGDNSNIEFEVKLIAKSTRSGRPRSAGLASERSGSSSAHRGKDWWTK